MAVGTPFSFPPYIMYTPPFQGLQSAYQSHGAAFVYCLSPLRDCEILNNRERFLLILEFQVPSMVTGFP